MKASLVPQGYEGIRYVVVVPFCNFKSGCGCFVRVARKTAKPKMSSDRLKLMKERSKLRRQLLAQQVGFQSTIVNFAGRI